jgi:hypothetical protein
MSWLGLFGTVCSQKVINLALLESDIMFQGLKNAFADYRGGVFVH